MCSERDLFFTGGRLVFQNAVFAVGVRHFINFRCLLLVVLGFCCIYVAPLLSLEKADLQKTCLKTYSRYQTTKYKSLYNLCKFKMFTN